MNLYEASKPGYGTVVLSQRCPGDRIAGVEDDGMVGFFADYDYPFRVNHWDSVVDPDKPSIHHDAHLELCVVEDKFKTNTYPNDPVPRGKREALAFLEWFRDTHPEYKDMVIKYIGPPDGVVGDDDEDENEDETDAE